MATLRKHRKPFHSRKWPVKLRYLLAVYKTSRCTGVRNDVIDTNKWRRSPLPWHRVCCDPTRIEFLPILPRQRHTGIRLLGIFYTSNILCLHVLTSMLEETAGFRTCFFRHGTFEGHCHERNKTTINSTLLEQRFLNICESRTLSTSY